MAPGGGGGDPSPASTEFSDISINSPALGGPGVGAAVGARAGATAAGAGGAGDRAEQQAPRPSMSSESGSTVSAAVAEEKPGEGGQAYRPRRWRLEGGAGLHGVSTIGGARGRKKIEAFSPLKVVARGGGDPFLFAFFFLLLRAPPPYPLLLIMFCGSGGRTLSSFSPPPLPLPSPPLPPSWKYVVWLHGGHSVFYKSIWRYLLPSPPPPVPPTLHPGLVSVIIPSSIFVALPKARRRGRVCWHGHTLVCAFS